MGRRLPTMPDEGEENPYDLIEIARGRGMDVGPEAQRAAEAEAARRKQMIDAGGALQQFFAGKAGRPGSADAGLEQLRKRADEETTGAFAERKAGALRDVEGAEKQLDRVRSRTIEDTGFEREGVEHEGDNDPGSELSGMARAAVLKLGAKVPETASYAQIKKVAPWLVDQLKSQKREGGNDWGPNDGPYLSLVGQIAGGLAPRDTPLPTEGVSPRALAAGMQRLGARLGGDRSETNRRRLRSKPLEDLTGQMGVMRDLDALGADAPNWDTGLLKNKSDLGLWYGGLDSPQKAAMRSRLKGNLTNYIKSASGLAVTDAERKDLATVMPNENDDEDTLVAKWAEARNMTARQLENRITTSRLSDYNVDEYEELAREKGWWGQVATPASTVPAGTPPTAAIAQAGAGRPAPLSGPTAAPAGGKVQVRRKSDGKLYNVTPEKAQLLIERREAEAQ